MQTSTQSAERVFSATNSLEMAMLCCYVRTHPSQADIDSVKKHFNRKVDWALLFQLARVHGVMPLLYQGLTTMQTEAIPKGFLTQLKTHLHLNTLKNQRLSQELLRLLALLEAHNIPAVAFKGPTLAVLAYGSLARRQFGDLDILVAETDFLRAQTLLLEDGYLRGYKSASLDDTEAQDLAIMKRWGEYPLRHPEGLVTVDLHGRLIGGEFPLLSANFESFWENRVPITVLNTSLQSFCPEDMLIYLCIHGAKDFWKKLSWVCDIAALIETYPSMNWSRLIQQAQHLECEQMLLLGLSLTQAVLAVALPEPVAEHLKNRFKKRSLQLYIQARLLRSDYLKNVDIGNLQLLRFHGQLIENRQDQWRYLLTFSAQWILHRIQPNIKDSDFVSLPRRFYWFYYLIRPFRLLSKFLESTLKIHSPKQTD